VTVSLMNLSSVLLFAAVFFIITIARLVSVIYLREVFGQRRAEHLLRLWAARNGFEIIEFANCFFLTGPFLLGWIGTSRRPIFRVLIKDRDGNRRSGWVRVGGSLLGVWSNVATVKWAKATAPQGKTKGDVST